MKATATAVAFGLLTSPASANSIVRPKDAGAHATLRAALASSGEKSSALAKTFMGELAQKVALENYKTTDVDMDTVNTIKDFIQDIETHALAEHDADQQELQTAVDQITNCGLIPQQTVTEHQSTKADCDSRGDAHEQCRTEESSQHGEMSAACLEYRNYRMHDVRPLSNDCMPSHMQALDISADRVSKPRKLENMEQCLVNSATWLFKLHELYLKCKAELDDHDEQKEACEIAQEEFEQCTCDYRAHMISGCEAHHSCHESGSAEYAVVEARVQGRVPLRKNDHVAGEKIKCYFKVLEAAGADKQTVLAECEGLVPDTSAFNIQYPAVPDLESCPLPPSPCDDAWRTERYLSHAWQSSAPVSACHECSAAADPSHAGLTTDWSSPTPAPPDRFNIPGYNYFYKACVYHANWKWYTNKTEFECAELCTAEGAKCRAFEVGRDYGGSSNGQYNRPGGCRLQEHHSPVMDTDYCTKYNLDLYQKEYEWSTYYNRKVDECVWHHGIGDKVTNKTIEECAKMCDNTVGCVAFEYGVNHGRTNWNPGDCQPQNKATGRITPCKQGSNGYNIDIFVRKSAPGYQRLRERCTNGHNIKILEDKTLDDCANECDNDANCLSFESAVAYGHDEPALGRCQLQNVADADPANVCSGYNYDHYKKL